MKYFFVLVLLLGGMAAAQTFQTEKSILCDEQVRVLDTLKTKWGEHIVWAGIDITGDSGYIKTINEKEGTWTFLQVNGKVACLLGTGNKSTVVPVTDAPGSL